MYIYIYINLIGSESNGKMPSLGVFEEDHAGSRATQGLVCGCGDHVAVLEGRRVLPCGHQPTDVGDVCHQDGSDLLAT